MNTPMSARAAGSRPVLLENVMPVQVDVSEPQSASSAIAAWIASRGRGVEKPT